METDDKVRELANEAVRAHEVRTRGDGSRYWARRDDAPDWVQDLAFAAHGVDGSLPNDHRYRATVHACNAIADSTGDLDDLAHDWADSEVDAYTHDLLTWLRDGGLAWTDEAVSEGLCAEDAGVEARCQAGQYVEALAVYSAILTFLRDRADEEGDDE